MKAGFKRLFNYAALCIGLFFWVNASGQEVLEKAYWKFAVSGDSRNCGDVVMPAIANSVLKHQVDFYWHLGDFRKMSGIDEDMAIRYGGLLSIDDYHRNAWGDFIAHQIAPFGVL